MKIFSEIFGAAVRSVRPRSVAEQPSPIPGAVPGAPGTGSAVGLPASQRPRLSDEQLRETLIDPNRSNADPTALQVSQSCYRDRNAAANFPPPEFTRSLLARTGVVLVDLETGAELRRLQHKLDVLARKIRRLTPLEIIAGRKKARARIAAGEPKVGDDLHMLGTAAGLAESVRRRKVLKLERNALLEKSSAVLLKIAERLESVAQSTMPQLEQEDQTAYSAWSKDLTGWRPSEALRQIALLTWTPSLIAKGSVMTPKRFLAGLGIELGAVKTAKQQQKKG